MQEVQLAPAHPEDLEALVAIRIAAMRESLERIGRFDPNRARERFAQTYEPGCTRKVMLHGVLVGFLVTRRAELALLLDHLYVLPEHQGKGIGAHVLAGVVQQANELGLPVRVGALRESRSNAFYIRHGFRLVEQAEFDNYYVKAQGAA